MRTPALALAVVAVVLAAGVACSASRNSPATVRTSTVASDPRLSSAAPPPSHPATGTGPRALALPPGTRRLRIDNAAAFAPMSGPYDLALGADAVWAAGGPYRIDPRSNTVAGPFTDQGADVVAAGNGAVWASAFAGSAVRRFDPRTGRLTATVTLPGDGPSPDGIAVTRSGVWVADHHGGTLYRVDPRTDAVVQRVRVSDPGSSGPEFLTTGAGSVWAGVPNGAAVVRIDARSGSVLARIATDDRFAPSGDVTVTPTAAWISESFAGTHIARIDLRTDKVTAVIDTGGYVVQPAADGAAVWFAVGGRPGQSPQSPAYLVKMRDNGTIAERYALGTTFQPGGLVIGFRSIWVSSTSQPIVLRIPYRRG